MLISFHICQQLNGCKRFFNTLAHRIQCSCGELLIVLISQKIKSRFRETSEWFRGYWQSLNRMSDLLNVVSRMPFLSHHGRCRNIMQHGRPLVVCRTNVAISPSSRWRAGGFTCIRVHINQWTYYSFRPVLALTYLSKHPWQMIAQSKTALPITLFSYCFIFLCRNCSFRTECQNHNSLLSLLQG